MLLIKNYIQSTIKIDQINGRKFGYKITDNHQGIRIAGYSPRITYIQFTKRSRLYSTILVETNWVYYWCDGQLISVYYTNSISKEIRYQWIDGRLKKIVHYDRGRKHGKYYLFMINNSDSTDGFETYNHDLNLDLIESYGEYIRNKLHGVIYHFNQNKIEEINTYRMDKLHGKTYEWRNGQIREISLWRCGKLLSLFTRERMRCDASKLTDE